MRSNLKSMAHSGTGFEDINSMIMTNFSGTRPSKTSQMPRSTAMSNAQMLHANTDINAIMGMKPGATGNSA